MDIHSCQLVIVLESNVIGSREMMYVGAFDGHFYSSIVVWFEVNGFGHYLWLQRIIRSLYVGRRAEDF